MTCVLTYLDNEEQHSIEHVMVLFWVNVFIILPYLRSFVKKLTLMSYISELTIE